MSLAHDLLEQAQQLALHDRRRPKQANLRRAISTAYYAVFHLLVEAAAHRMARDVQSRRVIQRSFEHKAMKEFALELAPAPQKGNSAPGPSRKVRGYFETVPAELWTVAEGFWRLQHQRHLADYDPDFSPDRATALEAVADARDVFDAWHFVESANRTEADRFLTLLLLYKQLKD